MKGEFKMEHNYWLIPMDFENCDFQQMEAEWSKNKRIMWQVAGTPKYKNKLDKWVIEKGLAKTLKAGDVVYFYVTNLPSSSGKTQSRILLRGVIEEEPQPVLYKEVYWNSDDNSTMINGFSISNITTLPKELLDNNLFFSLDYLKSKDSNFMHPQGWTNWPNKQKGNLSCCIIELLEDNFKKESNKSDFEKLINHFNQECYFCGKMGNKSDHKTFKRRNGTDYFEYHHFIQQHKGKNIFELNGLIYDKRNLLCLCSNCHNQIHYGMDKNVTKMIELIYADESIQNMLDEYKFSSFVQGDMLDWIKKVYISNYRPERKENDNV